MINNQITIVTPTKNAARHIGSLAKSLEAQSRLDFIWLVADSGSIDDTIHIVEATELENKNILRGEDFSIYHGLNRAILHVQTQYYLVVGADDTLDRCAIENYYTLIGLNNEPDLIFSAIRRGRQIIYPRQKLGWLLGMHGIGSSHSVGTLIKTQLHHRFGLYSSRFPMMADAYFLKIAVTAGVATVHSSFIAGCYGLSGYSSSDSFHYLLEFFEVQLKTEPMPGLQYVLFILRIAKLGLAQLI
ncbi:glycosyltransferase [Cyanobium sp. ATX 6F1]|uniref:glycosyltransferase n=1 Tax=unclassified Cyanobium TaxID=2627006 RepID=UPI0020CF067D|nr:glycosyltransferase [Cyanobium sp. ATX 6F1]MCP9916644.1 glycosyltransferase [Cyanobium sp. ATX 6F1]